MCTISWVQRPDGFDILCNRDELKSRQPALPPRIAECNGVKYIAPIDGDAGGSWIASNELGITVGLLNYYQECVDLPPHDYISRGGLVISLMDAENQEAVHQRMYADSLRDYRPFELLVFQAGREVDLYTWNGELCSQRKLTGPMRPITTSSFWPDAVEKHRMETFDRMQAEFGEPTMEWLREYHASCSTRGGAFGVCASREDAGTVSFSHIHMAPAGCTFTYQPGAPCLPEPEYVTVTLDAVTAGLPVPPR